MATIMAGTTGKADAANFSICQQCRAPGIFDFLDQSKNSEGWDASYVNETVTVPPEAAPGDYTMTVRNNASGPCWYQPSITTAPCKHLTFTVTSATTPDDPPGPGTPPC
jgi:hypothetical protein